MNKYRIRGDIMILRKPYAFLVKNFKIIHLVMAFLMGFLLFRTNNLLQFFMDYIASNQLNKVENATNVLFNIYMSLFPFLIIVLSIIIISLMHEKKKPIMLYIYNIAVAIGILIFYNVSYSLVLSMETSLLESRTVRLFRDFITMFMLIQGVSFILTLIRGTGFDIKKFDFGKDLQELDITETDNEEFEVDINIETNEVQRKINKGVRFGRYIYYENKFLIDTFILIFITCICFVAYMGIGFYERDVNENTLFSTRSFYLKVNKTYVTNKDYKGNVILKNHYLVVLELQIKSKGSTKKLETVTTELEIGGKKYYHTNKYRDQVFDIGHTYEDSKIGMDYEKHLLVYEVPNTVDLNDMSLIYTDKIDYLLEGINPKFITVSLGPIKIDENSSRNNQSLNDTVQFQDSIFKDTKMTISNYSVAPYFKEDYMLCVTDKECYPSIEYVRPSYTDNYDKALLKLEGNLEIDSSIVLNDVYSLYHFIHYFGTLHYVIDGKPKVQRVNLKRIQPVKAKKNNVYYMEVLEEVKDASSIWIDFHVRNREYHYVLK